MPVLVLRKPQAVAGGSGVGAARWSSRHLDRSADDAALWSARGKTNALCARQTQSQQVCVTTCVVQCGERNRTATAKSSREGKFFCHVYIPSQPGIMHTRINNYSFSPSPAESRARRAKVPHSSRSCALATAHASADAMLLLVTPAHNAVPRGAHQLHWWTTGTSSTYVRAGRLRGSELSLKPVLSRVHVPSGRHASTMHEEGVDTVTAIVPSANFITVLAVARGRCSSWSAAADARGLGRGCRAIAPRRPIANHGPS